MSPAEFRVYVYVLRRAQSYGKCSDPVNKIADHCRLCRNLTLKALNTLTYVYKLLTRNKRVGETDEYSIASQCEWAPPVPLEDRLKSRQVREAEENPSLQSIGCDLEESLLIPDEDAKVIDLKEYQEQKQLEYIASSSHDQEEKGTIWRRNPDATRYCQIRQFTIKQSVWKYSNRWIQKD